MPPPQDLKTAIERILSTPFPDNERSVEIKVILPLLSALGWDVHGDDVKYHYKVGDTRNKSQGVVNIALFGRRGALCLMEVKNTDEQLDMHVNQLLRYAFREACLACMQGQCLAHMGYAYEGVAVCVLTNGREWWLYLPLEGGKPKTRKFSQLNLETDTLDFLAEQMQLFLSKQNLESGHAEQTGRERLLGKRERDIWKQMLETPHKGLLQVMTDCIEEETGTRPSQARVVAILSETSFDAKMPNRGTNLTGKTAGKRKRSSSSKIYGVRLWGQFRETRRWADAYLLLANEMYVRHSGEFFETVSNLKGSMYPWFSYSKEACSTPSTPARFLEDSRPRIYVHVHVSEVTIRRKSKRLLEAFGYPSGDTSIWEIVTE